MKRTIVGLATVLFFVGLNLPQAGASNVHTCYFNDISPHSPWTDWEVKKTIVCTANKFGVSSSKALAIAWRESHYDEWAFNNTGCGGSGCGGLFQHHMAYWAGRADAYPHWQEWMHISSDCWCNPRINALVTIKMVQESGWGPWGG